MRLLALEGSGDFRAALLKNGSTQDHEQPDRGKKDEGAQRCNHRIDPSWERPTELDLLCSSLAIDRSSEAMQCSLYVLICQAGSCIGRMGGKLT